MKTIDFTKMSEKEIAAILRKNMKMGKIEAMEFSAIISGRMKSDIVKSNVTTTKARRGGRIGFATWSKAQRSAAAKKGWLGRIRQFSGAVNKVTRNIPLSNRQALSKGTLRLFRASQGLKKGIEKRNFTRGVLGGLAGHAIERGAQMAALPVAIATGRLAQRINPRWGRAGALAGAGATLFLGRAAANIVNARIAGLNPSQLYRTRRGEILRNRRGNPLFKKGVSNSAILRRMGGSATGRLAGAALPHLKKLPGMAKGVAGHIKMSRDTARKAGYSGFAIPMKKWTTPKGKTGYGWRPPKGTTARNIFMMLGKKKPSRALVPYEPWRVVKEVRGKSKLIVGTQTKGNTARDAYGRMAKKMKKKKMSMQMMKELSLETRAQNIRDGLRKLLESYTNPYYWINEIYDDYVIVCGDGKYYRADWGKNSDGSYWLSDKTDWVEVQRSWEEVDEKSMKFPIYSEKARRGGRGGFALWTKQMRSAAAKKGWAGRARSTVSKVASNAKNRFMAGRNKIVSGRTLINAARHPVSTAAGVGKKITHKIGSAGSKIKHGVGGKLLKAARWTRGGNNSRELKKIFGKNKRGLAVARRGGYLGIALQKAGSYLSKEFQAPATMTVFKDKNDDYRWLMLSSNAFRDRDGEIVSKKGLERDLAQWELEGAPKQPLRAWHIPLSDDYVKGLELGECDTRFMHGRTLVESGTFLAKEIGEAVYNNQDKLAASVGFRHAPTQPEPDGVFTNFRIFERSLLPKANASNALTSLMVV